MQRNKILRNSGGTEIAKYLQNVCVFSIVAFTFHFRGSVKLRASHTYVSRRSAVCNKDRKIFSIYDDVAAESLDIFKIIVQVRIILFKSVP